MKKLAKKVIASMMSVATLATSVVGISTNAANTENNYFNSFSIQPAQGGWTRLNQTDFKTDDSWVYLYISSSTRAARVHTLGVSMYNYSNYSVCTWDPSGAYCVAGPEYLISNYIYEDGYRRADLEFYSVSDNYGDTISGAWSPDSYLETGHSYTYV